MICNFVQFESETYYHVKKKFESGKTILNPNE